MSYIALYRKWRPRIFEDVVEQEHVVRTLKNSIQSDRIAHAYLFCGTRGTGKTTMAHIFSRAINCLNPNDGDPCNECDICKGILNGSILDVVEIDAASNNSVDNVREIRDEVIYAPSQAKYKVYIIDEVHMLSTGAFNALLKTLEEPPSHVVFILATTEPHKLPATILSRCQRFDFRRITLESIIQRILTIADSNGVSVSPDASRLIAKMADGALRDAISILDQCLSTGAKEINYSDVLSVVGIVNDAFMTEITDAIIKKDVSAIIVMLEKLVMDGKDIRQFISDLVYYLRNVLVCGISKSPEELIEVSPETLKSMMFQQKALSRDQIMGIIRELSALDSELKWASHPRILVEVTLIKICETDYSQDTSSLMERLNALESRIANGQIEVKACNYQGGVSSKSSSDASYEKTYVTSASQTSSVQEGSLNESTASAQAKTKAPLSDIAGIKKSTQSKETYDKWNELLTELKNSGRMVLYSNLLDAKAVILGEHVLGIIFGVGSSFKKTLVSKYENLEVVQGIVQKLSGKEYHIKCLDENDSLETVKTDPGEEFVRKIESKAKELEVPYKVIDE